MKISNECNLSYFDRNFKPGCVIYWYCSFLHPHPKYKYLFVCCVKPLILFPINSEITLYIKSKHLECTQISLQKSLHPFLKIDSYLDCHDVFGETSQLYKIKLEDIKNDAINSDKIFIKGEINPDIIRQVIETLSNGGKTLRKKDKELIIQSLSFYR